MISLIIHQAGEKERREGNLFSAMAIAEVESTIPPGAENRYNNHWYKTGCGAADSKEGNT